MAGMDIEPGTPTTYCAWCKEKMYDGDPAVTVISHGICAECEQKHFTQLQEENDHAEAPVHSR